MGSHHHCRATHDLADRGPSRLLALPGETLVVDEHRPPRDPASRNQRHHEIRLRDDADHHPPCMTGRPVTPWSSISRAASSTDMAASAVIGAEVMMSPTRVAGRPAALGSAQGTPRSAQGTPRSAQGTPRSAQGTSGTSATRCEDDALIVGLPQIEMRNAPALGGRSSILREAPGRRPIAMSRLVSIRHRPGETGGLQSGAAPVAPASTFKREPNLVGRTQSAIAPKTTRAAMICLPVRPAPAVPSSPRGRQA
jgi:hypothetical protein